MRLRVAFVAMLTVGFCEPGFASVIGPGDFGAKAIVQTFDSLTPNTNGAYGPLVLEGVTYATSSPDIYRVLSGPSDCHSGSCLGTHLDNAWFHVTLDNPVGRVGEYVTGSNLAFAVFYD